MNASTKYRWRVFVDLVLPPGKTVALPKAASHHLCTVLRLQAGDAIILFNGDGNNYPALLSAAGKKASAEILGVEHNDTESPLALELIQGISRGDRMDTTLQKAVELGVTAIHPVMTDKSAVRLTGDRLQKKMQHWQGIIISACEQSGRSRLPALSTPQTLTAWIGKMSPAGSADHSGSDWLLLPDAEQKIGCINSPATPCRVLIGPESGLSEEEVRRCTQAGFEPLSLGPRILRTETAGPTVIAILQSRFGDLQ